MNPLTCSVNISPTCYKFVANSRITDLEQDRRFGKRRFTDFVFQRLRTKESPRPLPSAPHDNSSQIQEEVRPASGHAVGGAPTIRATSPGAEVRDALQRGATRAQLLEQQKRNLSSEANETQDYTQYDSNQKADAGPASVKRPLAARRFHLSRSNLTPVSFKHTGRIWKHKQYSKPYLATFVEKHGDRLSSGELRSSHKASAIDRLIQDSNFSPQTVSFQHGSSFGQPTDSASATVYNTTQIIQPFVKAPAKVAKTGNSIRDHPSTWDHDSDQLANELAALAMEISEDDNAKGEDHKQLETQRQCPSEVADTDVDLDDVYVYETYLRVRRSELSPEYDTKTNNTGMLVIEEQDEELWQTFAENDEDSEWDEEDEDSNGMAVALIAILLLTIL